MTRDEAKKVIRDHGQGMSPDLALELFTRLGMLKLDEPKSVRDKLVDLLRRKDWTASDVDEFRGCICAAGLKIVEK